MASVLLKITCLAGALPRVLRQLQRTHSSGAGRQAAGLVSLKAPAATTKGHMGRLTKLTVAQNLTEPLA